MTDHPIKRALELIDDSIRAIREAHDQDVKIQQQLTLKQVGNGGKQIANQGNITINIVNQTVLLNLVEIREALRTVSDEDFLPTLNVNQLRILALRKAIETTGDNRTESGRLLGVTPRCVRVWRREIGLEPLAIGMGASPAGRAGVKRIGRGMESPKTLTRDPGAE